MDMKNKLSKRPYNEIDVHNTTADDFQEDSQIFRIPKRSKYEIKKKNTRDQRLTNKNLKKINIVNEISSVTVSKQEEPFDKVTENEDFLNSLETSLNAETEKICPSCKYIIHPENFLKHFTVCIKRFAHCKEPQKEHSDNIIPCPICSKAIFPYAKNILKSHVDSCAAKNNVSAEQLISALKLIEKLSKKKDDIELSTNSSFSKNRFQSKNSSMSHVKDDTDLELAVALSRSVTLDKICRRQREEDKLLSLGAAAIIQEDRRKMTIEEMPLISKSVKVSKSLRNRNRSKMKTVLETRTSSEREHIINEKVASLLQFTDDLVPNRHIFSFKQTQGPITEFMDKKCTLWNLAHSSSSIAVEDHYVAELEDFIKPQYGDVGQLFKQFSQIPGRLNYTITAENDDDIEVETQVDESLIDCESTIAEAYTTQFILSELVGSQELTNFSFFNETLKEKSFLPDENIDCERNELVSDDLHDVIGNDSRSNVSKFEIDDKVEHNLLVESINLCHSDEIDKGSSRIDDENCIENSTSDTNDDQIVEDVVDVEHDQLAINQYNIVINNDPIAVNGEGVNDEFVTKGNEFVTDDNSIVVDDDMIVANSDLDSNNCESTDSSLILKNSSSISDESKEVNKLVTLNENLCSSWSQLLINGEHHDIVVFTGGENMKSHSLVLKVRCPLLATEITNFNTLDLTLYSYRSIFIFFTFLYSATCVCLSGDLQRSEVLELAKKYNCEELHQHIESLKEQVPTKLQLIIKSISPKQLPSSVCQRNISPEFFSHHDLISPFEEKIDPIGQSPVKTVSDEVLNHSSPDLFEESYNDLNDNTKIAKRNSFNENLETRRKLSYDPIETVASTCNLEGNVVVDLTLTSEDSRESIERENLSLSTSFDRISMDFESKEQPLRERISKCSTKTDAPDDDIARHNSADDVDLICLLTPSSDKNKSQVLVTIDDSEAKLTHPPCDEFSDQTLMLALDSVDDDVNNKTPLNRFKNIHSEAIKNTPVDVTPCPNYRGMVTPVLKRELEKYGIRKMSRKKAVILLLHIYDQMHPIVSDSDNEAPLVSPTNKKQRLAKRSPRKYLDKGSPEKEEILNSSQTSNTSLEGSDIDETIFVTEEDFEDELSSSQSVDTEQRLMDFIKNDQELHVKILLYQPIWANELLVSVKSKGIKCSMAKLTDFLDNQCITFRLPSNRNERRKKRKSPRKNKS